MRAITIQQPWAELILRGEKDVEYRATRTHHRGPLLVHAGLRIGADLEENGVPGDVVRGAIVGVVEIVDCTRGRRSDRDWRWHLARPRRFKKPIRVTGQLGLWSLPARTARKLPKALRAKVKTVRRATVARRSRTRRSAKR